MVDIIFIKIHLFIKCIYTALFQKTDQSTVQYYSIKIHTSKNTKQILKAI